MHRKVKKIFYLIVVFVIAIFAVWYLQKLGINADVDLGAKAFPSCEGFGCSATGGRGGQVYAVTNLNDSGEGSLRWAVGQVNDANARIVVFNTGGVIELNSPLNIRPNTTVAGQTAIGDGIVIKGTVNIESNTILRYLRIRPGEVSDGDAIEVNGSNIVIDHCSISWANDEAIGFKRNQEMSQEIPIDRNATIQWSILGEEEKGILAWFGHKTSIHHNLFAHHDYRSPNTAGGGGEPSVFDVVNNVVYDVSEAASQAPGSVNLNYVNNYTIAPRDSRDHVHSLVIDDTNTLVKIFAEGNVGPHTRKGEPAWNEVRAETDGPATESIHRVSEPYPTPHITTQTAEQAFELVLNQAGANKPKRDPIDTRIVDRVRTGTYSNVIRDPWMARSLAAESWASLTYQSGSPVIDTDKDGLPDNWESSNGLNPNDPSDSALDSNNNGYTNIEEYSFDITGEGSGSYTPPASTPTPTPEPNNSPQLTSPGDKNAIVGQELSFRLEAEDVDGDSLSYSSTTIPDNANLDSATGQFTWTPDSEQIGSHIIEFTVSDSKDNATESITIIVQDQEQEKTQNQSPVLNEIGNHEVTQGDKLEFTIEATDPDNDSILYSSNTLPNGAFLDQETGLFEWIPTEDQKGEFTVSFDASDGVLIDSKSSIITVIELPQNSEPILSPIGNKQVEAGQTLSFMVEASDPDGDNLYFNASTLPQGAVFDPSTQEFYWTPTIEQTGIYIISFSVTDNSKGDYEVVEINVSAPIAIQTPTPTPEPSLTPTATVPTVTPSVISSQTVTPQHSITPTSQITITAPPASPTTISTQTPINGVTTEPEVRKEKRISIPKNTKAKKSTESQLVKLVKSPEEKRLINSGIDEILIAYKDVNLPSDNLINVNYYRLLEGKMFDPIVKVNQDSAEKIKNMQFIILKNGKQLSSATLKKNNEIKSSNKVYFLADESISLNGAGVYQIYIKTEGIENAGMIKNCLVDPAGYIYYKNKSGEEVRIEEATVTLEVEQDSKFTAWNATEFGQENPQITKADGNYSFLVPAGIYRLIVEKEGYTKVKTDSFEVKDQIVIKNIEMEKEADLATLIIASSAVLVLLIITALVIRKRSRSKNHINSKKVL